MHPTERETMLLRLRHLSLLACLALSCSPFLRAQQNESQDEGPLKNPPQAQQQQSSPDQDQDLQTFKAQVNVVNLFFNVKDKHGMLIPNLTKDSFDVFEDGKPQTVKYFSAEGDQPLPLGIMIDTSASQTRVLDIEQSSC